LSKWIIRVDDPIDADDDEMDEVLSAKVQLLENALRVLREEI
jgi:hypothetical protein